MDKMKEKFKENIKALVEAGNLEKAKALLNDYIEFAKDDVEAYSIKGVIAMMEGKMDEAEELFKEGFTVNNFNFDINYNLGYLYEKMKNYFKSVLHYKKALFQLEEGEERESLQFLIDSIEYGEFDEESIKQMREYKNQVKKYAKHQMMNINKELDPKKYITIENPIKDKRIKVLFASMEISNMMNLYTQSLRKLKYQAFSVNYYPTYLNYSTDYSESIRNKPWCESKKKFADLASYFISEFDVFHFFFNTTLMLDHSDLLPLKKLQKKVIMHNLGSEVRQYSKAVKMNKYWELVKESYFKGLDEKRAMEKIDFFSSWIDNCITVEGELSQYLEPYYKNCFFSKVPINLELYNFNHHVKKSKLLIVHAPTNANVKGSVYVIETLNRLKRKYNFDFELIKGMPHTEALKIYSKADIVIDQVIIGEHGILAVECMALGKPVVCWISDFSRKYYPEDLPIVSANVDNLYDEVEKLILDADLRRSLGIEGKKYVEKHHNVDNLVLELLNIYK